MPDLASKIFVESERPYAFVNAHRSATRLALSSWERQSPDWRFTARRPICAQSLSKTARFFGDALQPKPLLASALPLLTVGSPLAYRRLSPCLPRPINISSVTEDTNEQALRSRARNLGHAAAENSRARAAERLRRQPTPEASVGRYPPSERRLALPSPAQARTRGLDHRRMEDLRKGPPRKILLAYPNGTPPA